jgi:hypothetical protein
MNVSKEADGQFMRDLEREDPKRFAALIRNMRHAARKEQENTQGTPAFDAKIKRWDRQAARRAKVTGVLPSGWRLCAYTPCGEPFKPLRRTARFCSRRCLYRGTQNGLVLQEVPS